MKNFILILEILLAAILASSNVLFSQTDNNDRCEIRSHKSGSPMVRNTREASSCAEWGTFTNFSATDMNGGTHDIQSYLNQGKYVVIEFFCAWSGPCWQYYQGGPIEELYNTYGDGGTGEFVVLMVEGELTNTEAQITGTSTSEDYAGMSQGDFTNGGTNPVPIIDATENLVENVSLYEGYVPSVYLFCPAGYVFDIFTNDQLTANEIYNFATRTCPTEESLPDIGIAKPNVVRMGETATFSSCVVSLTDVTYAWTFEDGTPETSTDAIVDVVWDTPGMHRISLTVANVNGQVEHPDSVYVIDCSSGISTFPFVEDFESGQGCWTLESANTVNEITIGEYSNGMNGLIFSSYDQANNYNQYFISPELHHTGELNLSFKYKKDGSQSTGEKFYVKYSTTTSDISSFITLGSMITANSNSWETYTGTLPADAKYFMINYNTDYQYYLVVDDLTIERAAYWTCDFEGDEIWTFGNDQQDGNVQWQIVTPDTYSSALISGDNAYIRPFVFNGDTLSNTPDHWAMVDLISQNSSLGGPGQVAESPYIEFGGIDLSDAEHPQLRFNQIYRRINTVETIIKVSSDGGQTWVDHTLNSEVGSNEYGKYFYNKDGIDIYEAAGSQSVLIRFYMNSEGSGAAEGYGWEIDDIQIVEAPQCDLTLQDARISMFGYIDYRNVPDDFQPTITDPEERRETAYQFYDPYAQSPRKQWATESGYAAFNVEISSYGYDTVTPTARVKITNPNGVEIYNRETSSTRVLANNEGDTVDFFNSSSFYFEGIESYEDIITGRYTVDFYVFADGMEDADESDNHTTQYFYITDNIFSMSYDEPTGYTDFNRYTVSSSGDEYGISFTYSYQPERNIVVEAYIDEHTTVGTMAQAIIYEFGGDGLPIEVGSSNMLEITSDMLGSWVNFPLNDHVNSDTTFMVAIRGIWNDGETFAVGSSDELTSKGHNCYMRLLNQNDSWCYAAPQLAIRVRELNEYNIEVLTSNQEYGYVTGGGTYDEGSEVTITATPNQGYRFVSWDDGNTDDIRTITVTSDSTFVANFRESSDDDLTIYWSCDFEEGSPEPYITKTDESEEIWQIITEADYPDEMYTIEGFCFFLPMNYTGHEGNTDPNQQISETPEHWAFVDACSDLHESPPFVNTSMTFTNINLSACSKPKLSFKQSWKVLSPIYETISVETSIDGGTTWTTHVINDEDLEARVYVNGNKDVLILEAGGANNVYIRFNYACNSEEAWNYGWQIDDIKITEAVTVIVLPNDTTMGMVSGGGTYDKGADIVITATPYDGYCFMSWDDGNEDNPRAITVTSDSTFIANFSGPILFTIDTVVNNFVTVGDHTFYSTGNYAFSIPSETGCDTIYDINLRVLAEPVYDIGPNPTEKILNITSDSFISYVEFYSPTGQLVMRKEVNGYEAEFDLEGLVDGVYILRIYGEESSLPSVSKVVKE